jgi:colicin import membrane protein
MTPKKSIPATAPGVGGVGDCACLHGVALGSKGTLKAALGCLLFAAATLAHATLPPPSPAQAQAAAAKKAKADAQAAKEKEELLATMDKLAARWRSKASSQGVHTNPPVAVAAPTPAVNAPATGAAPAGQPGGTPGPAAQAAPIRSEKFGTAPPSADVKKKP